MKSEGFLHCPLKPALCHIFYIKGLKDHFIIIDIHRRSPHK